MYTQAQQLGITNERYNILSELLVTILRARCNETGDGHLCNTMPNEITITSIESDTYHIHVSGVNRNYIISLNNNETDGVLKTNISTGGMPRMTGLRTDSFTSNEAPAGV